jgi:hypothetical protein
MGRYGRSDRTGAKATGAKANLINHVVLVLDGSSSIAQSRLVESLIKVADDQVKHLAMRSKELDQETRVTVFTFADDTQCVVWDMDVLRMPTIRNYYGPNGNTALIDATAGAIADLLLTPQKYGDHSFLLFALTDGEENVSITPAGTLSKMIRELPENWTVAALVPNAHGVREAKQFGFPAGNVQIWDATSERGAAEVGLVMSSATDAYMTARSTGVRSTRNLFSTGVDAVNKETIKAAGLKPLPSEAYRIWPVALDREPKVMIEPFVKAMGATFARGRGYYRLDKTETIQGGKSIVIRRKRDGKVFSGVGVRDMLGLGADAVRVKPDFNPEYDVFVQSTSNNRNLYNGTELFYLV